MKDPAFLFYPNDYMGGTMGMTFEEKGAYMDLLVLQFNKGAFTIDQAKKVLNGAFDRVWPVLVEKFVQEENKFFNKRLKVEKEKREVNAQKNKERIQKYWDTKNTNGDTVEYSNEHTNVDTKTVPIENENRNENRIINENENSFGKSENLLIPKMFRLWKKKKPNYPEDQDKDFKALKNISAFICKQSGISYQPREPDLIEKVMEAWEVLADFVIQDDFYNSKSLTTVNNNLQSIVSKIQNEQSNPKAKGQRSSKITDTELHTVFTQRRSKGQSVTDTG